MTYIIHGAPGSGSCIVEAACAEIGVDYEVRDLDARGNEHRGEAYAALNPQRKMPTLEVEGGEIITESAAIVLTLDERHRDAGLLPPPGSPARAQAVRWMLVFATEFYPVVEIMDYPERFAPAPASPEAMHERAKEIWHERWLVVERSLAASAQPGGSPSMVDSGFSAADLYATLLSRWDLKEDWRRDHLPQVDALAAAVLARPSLAAVWKRHKLIKSDS
ncbi:MAG: glutathione S-transferase family protein [Myxococcota bacterium]